METKNHLKYKDKVKELISRHGTDETDNYLLNELSNCVKEVAAIRDEIERLNNSINEETNSDEMIHLKHDLEDKKEILVELLDKLMAADMMYICFKEFTNQ